jgi:hypothetical protein
VSEHVKEIITKRLTAAGFSESYGAVVHLLALMKSDPTTLQAEHGVELAVWRGHFEGLRSALHCMVMVEKKTGPKSTARIVSEHLAEALADFGSDSPALEW